MRRGYYVIAGLVASLPWLALSATAPLGNAWRWHEFPRSTTVVAAALGLWMCFRSMRGMAVWVPLGTALFSLVWEMGGEYIALSKLHRTDVFGSETGLLASNSVELLAPWLVGGIYALLAVLAIGASSKARTNRLRAGVWLVAVGALAMGFVLANQDWYAVDNYTQPGTSTTSVSWSGMKVLAAVMSAIAIAVGLAGIASGLVGARTNLPRAVARRSTP